MKKFLFWGMIGLICILLGLFGAWEVASHRTQSNEVRQHSDRIQQESWMIQGKPLTVEVVSAPEDVAQGLGGRLSLAEDAGMLFDLGSRGIHPFWMKGMLIPIDMIWLDRGEVVYIAEQVQPPAATHGVPTTILPPVMADQVLELSAGGAARFGLTQGVRIR